MATTGAGNLQNSLLSSLASYLSIESIESMTLRLIGAAVILFITVWIVIVLRRVFRSHLRPDDPTHHRDLLRYGKFFQSVVLVIGICLALHTLGIDLTHIFTAGGLLAVAGAFALKDLAANLYGGMTLLMEGVIKRGDILLLPDEGLVRVVRIGSRNTIVRSKSEANIILPNSFLVQNSVSNYTYGDGLCRAEATVGVAYSSDLELVRATLAQIGDTLDGRSTAHPAKVRLCEFGASAVTYKVQVWSEDPWDKCKFQSTLNEAIWKGLKAAGIEIAFPQLDVHVMSNSTKDPTA